MMYHNTCIYVLNLTVITTNNIPTIRCNPEFDRQGDYVHFHMHRSLKSLMSTYIQHLYFLEEKKITVVSFWRKYEHK